MVVSASEGLAGSAPQDALQQAPENLPDQDIGRERAREMAATKTQSEPDSINALSDVQLTDLAADWQQLDAAARSNLIAETRERMQPNQSPQNTATGKAAIALQQPAANGLRSKTSGKIKLRAERRRYGRVVRKADGSLVRIETQVVRVQRRDPQRAFGVGFERRHSQPIQQPARTPRLTQAATRAAGAPETRVPESQLPESQLEDAHEARPESSRPAATRADVLVVTESLD